MNRLFTLAAIGLLAFPAPGLAQGDDDLRDALDVFKEGMKSVPRAIHEGARIETARIEQARQRFWRLYPDGEGFEQAAIEFGELLWQKDYHYLMQELMRDILRAGDIPSHLVQHLNVQIDGGIREPAREDFEQWVNALRERGVRPPLFTRLPQAMEETKDIYERYMDLRNHIEFLISPRSPLRTDDPRQFLANLLIAGIWEEGRSTPESLEQAYVWVDSLHELVSAETVRQVLQTPRWYGGNRPYMPGPGPGEIHPGQYTANRVSDGLFRYLRAAEPDNARQWLATLYVTGWGTMEQARQTIDELIRKHGEQRVLDAAERLRQVGKDDFEPDYLADYSGHRREPIRWWLERLFEDANFRLPSINRPITIDARDKAVVEAAAESAGLFHIIGTVSGANWVAGASRQLHLQVAEADHFRFIVSEHHPDVLHRVTGMNGEKVTGRQIRVRVASGHLNKTSQGLVLGQIVWPHSLQQHDVLTFVDGPVETIRELPSGIASQPGARVPWAEGTPDPVAERETRNANIRAFDDRLRRFFNDGFSFAVPLGDYMVHCRNVRASLGATQAGFQLNVEANLALAGKDPADPATAPAQELRRQYLRPYRQRALYHDLNWEAWTLAHNQHGLLMLRVPTIGGTAAVNHSSSIPSDPAQEKAYLDIPVPGRFAAERIVELFAEQSEAGASGWLHPPPQDEAHDLVLLRAERAIDYDGTRIQFRGDADDVAELRLAAESGHGPSMLLLGELIGQGHVEGGAAEAVRWFAKGHRAGSAACTARLALHLLMGRGVEANDPRRDDRYIHQLAQSAAERNDPLGMYLYAECLSKGIGGRANPRRARDFYIRSAAAGNSLAQRWCNENAIVFDGTDSPTRRGRAR